MSVIAPYYTLYRVRWFRDAASAPQQLLMNPSRYSLDVLQEISFELTPEEQPYAEAFAAEIEATYGHAFMPPEIGNTPVPDVCASSLVLGTETLYTCLFTEHW